MSGNYQLAPIVYYCYKRHGRFKRQVKLDLGLEPLRLIAGLTFRTIQTRTNHTSVVIATTLGFNNGALGIKASIPALLFGDNYYHARRVDINNIWDWRKSAFIPNVDSTIDNILAKVAHV